MKYIKKWEPQSQESNDPDAILLPISLTLQVELFTIMNLEPKR